MASSNQPGSRPLRIAIALGSVAGLILVFVAQHVNVAAWLHADGRAGFFINRTIRFILNDLLTIGLIWAVFHKRRLVIFALWVQLFGLLFFLIPYFVLKYFYPGYNGPMISFLHRLVLNPTLLLLLIPAFYFQAQQSGAGASPPEKEGAGGGRGESLHE